MAKRSKPRSKFLKLSVSEYRELAPENGPGGVREACLKLLKLYGFIVSITDAGRRVCKECGALVASEVEPGWPDITAISPWGDGLLWAVETKTANGRLSPAQKRVHARLRAAGAVVIVPRSASDLEREILARKPS